MKYILFIIVALMCCIGIQSVQAKGNNEKKEVAVFSVHPRMTCRNCENKIKSNLRFEKGISSITTDLKAQTVTISFDASKTDIQKIRKAFEKIGYQAYTDSLQVCPDEIKEACD